MKKTGWVVKVTNKTDSNDYYYLKKGAMFTFLDGNWAVKFEDAYKSRGHANRLCRKLSRWSDRLTYEPYEVEFGENGLPTV